MQAEFKDILWLPHAAGSYNLRVNDIPSRVRLWLLSPHLDHPLASISRLTSHHLPSSPRSTKQRQNDLPNQNRAQGRKDQRSCVPREAQNSPALNRTFERPKAGFTQYQNTSMCSSICPSSALGVCGGRSENNREGWQAKLAVCLSSNKYN